MSVPDAIAAAAGLELGVVHGYAESLADAGLWPDDVEQVEAKHMAALLVAVMATPEPEVVKCHSLKPLGRMFSVAPNAGILAKLAAPSGSPSAMSSPAPSRITKRVTIDCMAESPRGKSP